MSYDYNYFEKHGKFPDDALELHYGFAQLYKLPDIPKTIKRLYCYSNKLTELPELPESLYVLNCHYNNLYELPTLPKSLKLLTCGTNNLIELPELPESLKTLFCSKNNIKYLSQHNIRIFIQIGCLSDILHNPISDGFDDDKEFKDSLSRY
jgi:Leucine-rich repeat (LRR) protein